MLFYNYKRNKAVLWTIMEVSRWHANRYGWSDVAFQLISNSVSSRSVDVLSFSAKCRGGSTVLKSVLSFFFTTAARSKLCTAEIAHGFGEFFSLYGVTLSWTANTARRSGAQYMKTLLSKLHCTTAEKAVMKKVYKKLLAQRYQPSYV